LRRVEQQQFVQRVADRLEHIELQLERIAEL
jgi:hypothetical protein